jgi:hypothetical protein
MKTDVFVPVADPVSPDVLASELHPEMLLCRFRELEIYVTTAEESPTIMDEIGRIREREYRHVGAGRNVPRDIDVYDTGGGCYVQLFSWDPREREIVSMYRFIFGGNVAAEDIPRKLRTAILFEFSPEFQSEVLPLSVELGRSVVNRDARRAVLGLFAVWAGLGAFVVEFPDLRYFFGNVSIYSSWPSGAVDLLLAFLDEYYRDSRQLLTARSSVAYRSGAVGPVRETLFSRRTSSEGFITLLEELKGYGVAPPPILVSYLKATDSLHVYDTARDADFGGAWETAIAVPTHDLSDRTKRRFVDSYIPVNRDALRRFRTDSTGRRGRTAL